jgi:uncharacterized protein (TIGR01244 family)
MFRRIDERILVAGQIQPEDVERAKAEGVTMIVNNRPNGEEPGQPLAAEIEQAARAAGLDYRFIPIERTIDADQVAALEEAYDEAAGDLLLFCRSGTRSSYLWAAARQRQR